MASNVDERLSRLNRRVGRVKRSLIRAPPRAICTRGAGLGILAFEPDRRRRHFGPSPRSSCRASCRMPGRPAG